MTPKQIVTAWVESFNRADASALAEFYAEDAVNHQVALEPVTGKAAIRAMFETEFARTKMVCIPENLFQDGDWAILEWRDPYNFRGCGLFRIKDGKIAFQRGYWDARSFAKSREPKP
jgi:limonene-1,2-epoxide hydrolase